MKTKSAHMLPALLTVRATADGRIEDELTPYRQKAGVPELTLEEAIRLDIIALGGWLIRRQMDARERPECPICDVGLGKICTGFIE